MDRPSLTSTLKWLDRNEKGDSVDIVPFFPFLLSLVLTSSTSQDTLTFDIQALGPDLIEAAKYAQSMSAEDVDDIIDYILEEVEFFTPKSDAITHSPLDSMKTIPSVPL